MIEINNTINVRISSRDQLFSAYNFADDNLNPELSDYLLDKAKTMPVLPNLTNYEIKIHTDSSALRTAEAARCIHHHFHKAYAAARKEVKRLNITALTMLLVGLLALVPLFFIDQNLEGTVHFFLYEILDVVVWVFTWEAIDVFFLQRHSAHREAIILRRLAYANVSITGPLDAPTESETTY